MMANSRHSQIETGVYAVITALLALLQLAGVFRGRDPAGRTLPFNSQSLTHEFGFSQLRHLGPSIALLWFVALAVFLILLHRHEKSFRFIVRIIDRAIANPWVAGLIAIASAWLFYTLSNEFVNPDGRGARVAFIYAGTTPDAILTHDEIWEFFLHWKFWYWSKQHFGWTVIESYQFLSSLAGGVFIFLLIQVSRLLFMNHPSLITLAVTSGGFMQLFYGDVENYTLTAVLILLYIYSVLLHIQRRLPLVVPFAILAVASTFHLLATFLIPSLAYVSLLAVRKGSRRALAVPTAVYLAIILLTLVYFHFNGLPIRDLFYNTHALGHGGNILANLARPSFSLYLQHANLLLLLSPAVILIPALLFFRRIPTEPINLFLAIAAGSLVLFQLFWKSGIGVYNDWNLYAASAIPISLLVWSNFLRNVQMPLKAEVYAGFVTLAGMHSQVWIIWNHYFPYG
jgi:hypothetical protein